MKIGILYICIGKYDIFWKDFYISCEKNLLRGHEKHYFIFTDSNNIFDGENNDKIHIFPQENLGWPDNTLMRFHMFLSQRELLSKMDYLFFFNANIEIKKEIGEEILPKNEGLVVVKHPGYYNKSTIEFPYDRNLLSMAYIEKGEGDTYVQGALNGGKSQKFLQMCDVLSKNIDTDASKNITALWHDESHLNKYILTHTYKLLSPAYLHPGRKNLPFECKILIRNKSKYINITKVKGYWGPLIRNIRGYLNI